MISIVKRGRPSNYCKNVSSDESYRLRHSSWPTVLQRNNRVGGERVNIRSACTKVDHSTRDIKVCLEHM
jgi:hypothetical protein